MRTIILMSVGLVALLAACSAPPKASFDCAKAATKMETTICHSRPLAEDDLELARSYGLALKGLSAESHGTMVASERSFLDYASKMCLEGPAGASPVAGVTALYKGKPVKVSAAEGCLIDAFETRTGVLKAAITETGGYRFVETVTYDVTWSTSAEGTDSNGNVTTIKRLVQIDAPSSTAQVAWNKGMQARLETAAADAAASPEDGSPMPDTDVDAGLKVVSATPDLIVTSATESSYTHGMAHPLSYTRSTIWAMRLGRDLKSDDVFDSSKPWAKDLLPLAQANLKSLVEPAQTITGKIDTIDRIDRWVLKPDGLHLIFGEYDLGGYLSSAETVLPWAQVQPYLRADLPFDLAALRAQPLK